MCHKMKTRVFFSSRRQPLTSFRTIASSSHLLFEHVLLFRRDGILILCPPPLYLPAPNARSSECAVYGSVLVVVDVVEVNVIMGAGMDSLVVDVVEVNVIMGAGMHSLVSCFAVNNSDLAVVEVYIRML